MTIEATVDLAEGTVETPAPHVSQGDQVAEILRKGLQTPGQETAETQPQSAAPPSESWDIKRVAEKLGVDPANLYESLKVSIADGEELTVSALKDAYRPAAELEKARGKLLEEMESSKREVVQTQQEFSALLQLLGPQNLNQELLQEVNRRTEKQKADEAERLLKSIPEWKDPIARAAAWVDIRKSALNRGYSETEIRLAEAGLADHRWVKDQLDLARLRASEEKPKPQAKVAIAPKPSGVTSQAVNQRELKQAVKSGRMTETQAAARILRG